MTSRAPRLALATCSAVPDLYEEEREIVPRLQARGVDARAVVWSDASVEWASFDAVVIRSTWDYFERFEEFRAWLARIERSGVALHNPLPLVRWNSDKLYLRDLEAKGVPVVPTVFCEKGARGVRLEGILSDRGWPDAVLKPSVSGGAFRTHRVTAGNTAEAQREMEEILQSCAVLVQPFVPEILSEGEWSFFFFDGQLSHSVLKAPAAGDYRVQTQFGGTASRPTPEPWMVEAARGVLSALPVRPTYARIDGVRRGKEFLLMEAELIEPYLFLAAAPEAMESYVAVLQRVCPPR